MKYADPNKCPYCDSENIEIIDHEHSYYEEWFTAYMRCNDCEKRFQGSYWLQFMSYVLEDNDIYEEIDTKPKPDNSPAFGLVQRMARGEQVSVEEAKKIVAEQVAGKML